VKKIRTFSFGSASAAKFDVLILKKRVYYLTAANNKSKVNIEISQ